MLRRAGLQAVEWDGSGFLSRPLFPVLWLTARLPGLRWLGALLKELDARCFEATNLFCVAAKINTQTAARTRAPAE